MTSRSYVANRIQSQMNQQLESYDINIPKVHMSKLTEIIAIAVAEGLEEWERQFTDELQGKWKRDIEEGLRRKLGR